MESKYDWQMNTQSIWDFQKGEIRLEYTGSIQNDELKLTIHIPDEGEAKRLIEILNEPKQKPIRRTSKQ